VRCDQREVSGGLSGSRTTRWLNGAIFSGIAALALLAVFLMGQPDSREAAMKNLRLSRSREAEKAFKHPFDDLTGKPTPGLPLLSIDDKQVYLSGFSGDTILFFFSLDYCPPCQSELAALQQLLRETRGKVRVIGIVRQLSGRELAREILESRLRALDPGFPVVIGDSGTDRLFGNIQVVPGTFYIDSSGIIVRQSLNQNYQELRSFISRKQYVYMR
jgi:thiol-disulfide isomerase/thioredoxin